MLIHQGTSAQIELLKKNKPRNVVLVGPAGLGKSTCALKIAAAWLETSVEQLPYHVDFKQIEPDQGYIRAEQAEAIRQMAKYMTQNKAVCIVHGAESMTVELQNKLLKVLEDGADALAVIFVSTSPLLETVLSRCVMVRFDRIPLEQLYESLDHPVLPVLLASDGSVGAYQRIIGDRELCQYLEGFFKMYGAIKERGQLKQLLRITHALKEKDREFLPVLFDDWQMSVFLNMLYYLFYYLQLSLSGVSVPSFIRLGNLPKLYTLPEANKIFEMAEDARQQQAKKGNYTKNDFFSLLMYMMPLE